MKFITLGINSVILLLLFSITSGRRRHKRLLEKYYEFEPVKRHLINDLLSNDKRMVAKRDEANEDDDLKKVTLDEDLTYQSSTAGGREASKAISGDCLLNGYSESLRTSLPMWYVDMEKEWLIAKVVIGIQSAIGAGNFREAYLRVTDLEPSLQHRDFGKDFCGYFKGPAEPLQKVHMYCGKKGTFISVILKGNSMILEMCTLLAYSEPKEKEVSRLDVAPKFAKQVSTDHGRKASRAITGDCGTGQHSETLWAKWPMWYVDLRKEYRVTKVIVGTRRHSKARRFHNVHIIMLNEKPKFIEASRSIYHDGCAFYKGPAVAGEEVTFYCGQKGRYLVVKIDSSKFRSSLEMCRVKIYGIDKTAPPPVPTTAAAAAEAAAEASAAEGEGEGEGEGGGEGGGGGSGEATAAAAEGEGGGEEVEAMSQGNKLIMNHWIILVNLLLMILLYNRSHLNV